MSFEHKHARFKNRRGRVSHKRMPEVPEDGFYRSRLFGETRQSPTDETRCVAYVWKGYNKGQCDHKRRADSEGGLYCGHHDPIKIRAYNALVDDENEFRDEQARLWRKATDHKKALRKAAELFLQKCANGDHDDANDIASLAQMITEEPLSYLEQS